MLPALSWTPNTEAGMRTYQTVYWVHYEYANYTGSLLVEAETAEQAIAKGKNRMRPHMTLPMANESWQAEEVA